MLADDPDFTTDVIYGGSAGPGLLRQVGEHVDGLFLGRFAHDPPAIAGILDDVLALVPSSAVGDAGPVQVGVDEPLGRQRRPDDDHGSLP